MHLWCLQQSPSLIDRAPLARSHDAGCCLKELYPIPAQDAQQSRSSLKCPDEVRRKEIHTKKERMKEFTAHPAPFGVSPKRNLNSLPAE